jgi:hypothetical protein
VEQGDELEPVGIIPAVPRENRGKFGESAELGVRQDDAVGSAASWFDAERLADWAREGGVAGSL